MIGEIIKNVFYVDVLLTGANSIEVQLIVHHILHSSINL